MTHNAAVTAEKNLDQNLIEVQNAVSRYRPRRDELEGQSCVVVPATLLRVGVFNGSGGPTYYSLEALNRAAALWNGVVVAAYHPVDFTGHPVRIVDSPERFSQAAVGRVFNARMEGDALKGDLWIFESRLAAINPQLLDQIMRAAPVEISTGLLPTRVGGSGNWNNQSYESELIEMFPDHLALLADRPGACSYSDGCGIRNQGGDSMSDNDADTDAQSDMPIGWATKAVTFMRDLFVRSMVIDNEVSLTELHRKVIEALDAMDNAQYLFVLEELFKNKAIYRAAPRPGPNTQSQEQYFIAPYTLNEDGKVVFGEAKEVQKRTTYVALSDDTFQGGDEEMDEKVDQVKSSPEEEDKKKTDGVDTDAAAPAAEAAENVPATPPAPAAVAEPAPAPAQQSAAEGSDVNALQAFLNSAPPEVREVVADGIALQQQQKRQSIDRILKAPGNQFTEDMLANKSRKELDSIAALIPEVKTAGSYLGNAGAGVTDNANDPPLPVPSMADYADEK